jgi:hypothetical protein
MADDRRNVTTVATWRNRPRQFQDAILQRDEE